MDYQTRAQNRSQDRGNLGNSTTPFDTTPIRLATAKLPTDLFSRVAENAAQYVAGNKGPKSTQLRKFYDEICMWDDKSQRNGDRFEEYLPFILMLKAKVAYSKGRGHINEAYVNVINHCLEELEKNQKPETLHNMKLFMEAFTGFYKVHGPKK